MKPKTCCGVVLGVTWLISHAVAAQCGDWTQVSTPAGVDGAVYCSEVFDSGAGAKLYFGGSFDSAGALATPGVVCWNGSAFEALGSGVPGTVNALLRFPSSGAGQLYVGGQFVIAGGVFTVGIARWNGTSWSNVGGGLGDVRALAEHDDGSGPALYAAGFLGNDIAGQPVYGVAHWNGAAWSEVPGMQSPALELISHDDGSGPALFAYGKLLAGTQLQLARWNGVSWTNLGQTVGGHVQCLLVHDDGSGPALYAAGNFSSIGGVAASGIARWNGSVWSSVGGGTSGAIQALTVHDDGQGPKLYAAGGFTSIGGVAASNLARWDGASWSSCATNTVSSAPGGLGAGFSTLASYPAAVGQALFAGGAFDFVGGAAAGSVATWNNVQLEPLAPGIGQAVSVDGLVRDMLVSDLDGESALYATGDFTLAGNTAARSIARWNGSSWSALGAGIDGSVFAIEDHDDGSGRALYAVGEFSSAGGATVRNAARWNGSSWSAVGDELDVSWPALGVRALESSEVGGVRALYVGGTFYNANGAVRRVMRWNGVQWRSVDGGQPNGSVWALESFDDGSGVDLYAGGSFTGAGSAVAQGVARWDGESWSNVGAGLPGTVYDFAVFDDGAGPKLYAAGGFNGLVARWDGLQWTPIITSLSGSIANATLHAYDDGNGPALYFGAGFTSLNGQPFNRIARWNGQVWSGLGSGLGDASNTAVMAMTNFEDGAGPRGSLYVGGFFSRAGSHAASSFARWTDPCACGPVTYCVSGVTSSGCAPTVGASGRASASGASNLTITASSLEGQRSGHLFYGVSGPHASSWGSSTHQLCVKAPTQRTPPQTTGGTVGACDGSMTLDWGAFQNSHPGALGQPFAVGDQVWTQAYFRDPAGPKTTALSNALRFSICP